MSTMERREGNTAYEAPAPFIVGTGRCGTTLLREMMNAHPLLAIPSETHFIPTLVRQCRDALDPKGTFVDTILESKNWKTFGVSETDLKERVSTSERFDVGAAIRSFYALFAESHGKQRWGDKTPGYHAHMTTIEQILPEARFVHVIRDGRDVALSVKKMWEKSNGGPSGSASQIEDAIVWWAKRLARGREQGQRVQHYLEIRYEDLVVKPEVTLRSVCEFVDLPWDAATLRYFERNGSDPPDPTRLRRWQETMSPDGLKAAEELAGPLLHDLGYL